ncbi:MAG TPA: efflux RND transporter periplasmic adaptor subunit [Methylomirabilota bacterium]|nr:efflux RND transporter periplasmic adaptor subunit [Methylomirabilota bacterium]
MRAWKSFRIAALVLVLGGLVTAALWPQRIEVDVAEVVQRPMEVTIDEEGETRVRERFTVSAPVAGRLLRIDLEPGDTVVAGKTIVARLAPAASPLLDARTQSESAAAIDAAAAAAEQAIAERARARTVLDRASQSLDRARQLANSGAVSRADLDAADMETREAESALAAATAAVERAQREVEVARARLRTPSRAGRPVDVVAPVSGVVLTRRRESESVVAAGEPLMDLGDPEDAEVIVDLLSTDAVRVASQSAVRIEGWGGDTPLTGRVRRIEPSAFVKVSALGVEERRVNVIIDLDPLPRDCKLGDGYKVEARIVVWAGTAVTAPLGSLFRRGQEWAVFVVDNGRARLRPVTIGERNGEVAQVLSGLQPGDRVVMHPPDTLVAGGRVAIR